jgi:hypothetical protein
MNRFGVLTVLFFLGSTGYCQTTGTSGRTHSSPAPDLSQYRLKEVIFKVAALSPRSGYTTRSMSP